MPTVTMEVCAGCHRPIEDRFVMKVQDHFWHEQCLQCASCRQPLSVTCFQKDHKFYCRPDYDKLFRGRCSGCGFNISSNEMVMKALGNVYHIQCFRCVECHQILQRGEQFVINDGQLFCRFDFDKEYNIYSPKDTIDDDSDSYEDTDMDLDRATKRPRTILTTSQRRKFKAAFEMNPKPCRKVREQLAAESGLSVRVVQVWFQNQRAKVKKMSRREGVDENSKERKRVKSSRSCDDDKDLFSVSEADDKKIYSPDVDGNIFPGFDGSGMFMDIPTSSDDSAESPDQKPDGVTDIKSGCATNHINKLYSMQTSYFCAE